MIFILLVLMLIFSLLTLKTQNPSGSEAGRQVASAILAQHGRPVRVLIVAPDSKQDAAFAEAARADLESAGAAVVGVVVGTPGDLRKTLTSLVAEMKPENSAPVDAIAATEASSQWNVYDRFPGIGRSRCVVPQSYRWPDFLKLTNLVAVCNQTAIYAIIAIGMTMVIISGGIDLSVGAIVAFSSVTATVMIRDIGGGETAGIVTVVTGCITAILLSAAAGVVNGGLVTGCGIPPFIVTLSMMMMASGMALRLASGESITAVPESFRWIGGYESFGVPNPVLLMLGLYAVAHVVMSRTVFGRYLYAIGGNTEAARLSGVPVRRTLLTAYTICGALAGLGGVVLSSRLDAGNPKYGEMYELETIAAVVVGGTSLMGGEGRIFGTLIGAFIIAVIRNGMNLISVESFNQKIVLGGVLLLAVLADRFKRSRH